eukprot:gene735-biopygen3695
MLLLRYLVLVAVVAVVLRFEALDQLQPNDQRRWVPRPRLKVDAFPLHRRRQELARECQPARRTVAGLYLRIVSTGSVRGLIPRMGARLAARHHAREGGRWVVGCGRILLLNSRRATAHRHAIGRKDV